MKRKMATMLWVAACVLMLIAAPTAGAVGVPNPVRDVTAEEMFKEEGLAFNIPKEAQEVSYSVIEIADHKNICQVQFMLGGMQYCCRMQPSEALNDISGMNYEWTVEDTVALPFSQEVVVRYIDGGAGIILWYDAPLGLSYSISMDTGATLEALEAAAVWHTEPEGDAETAGDIGDAEDERMAVDYEIEGDTVLTVRLQANATTGYAWTFENSDETILACEKEEYVPDENQEGLAGVGGTYVAVFAPTMRDAGKVTLTFRYAREWETEEPAETYIFDLWINEAGLLTVEGVR